MATAPTEPNIRARPRASNQMLEFWWQAPTSDGGSPITGYTLSDGGTNTFSIDPSVGYFSVPGLTNGTTYTFTLTATNAIGTSDPATFRSVQPGNKPDPPSSLSVSSVTGTDALITWYSPANIGGTNTLLGTMLKGYILDANCNVLSNSPCTITNQIIGGAASQFQQYTMSLYSNYMWKVLVRPVNDPGYGPKTSFTSIIDLITPTPFSPSTFTNMSLWYDFSSQSSYNPAILDRSGTNNNATGTATTVSQLNGLNVGVFSGTYNFNVSTLFSNSLGGATVMMIYRPNTSGTGNGHPIFTTMLGANTHFFWVDGTHTESIGFSTVNTIPTGTFTFGTWALYGIHAISSINSTFVYKGGAQVYGNFHGTKYTSQGYSINLGSGSPALAEMVIYKASLSTLQRQSVEGYLAWKWGLSTLLPSYHPFYTRKPLFSDSVLDFSPSSIANMTLWIDAADSTTLTISSTNIVTAVRDKSGNGNHSSNVTGNVIISSLNGNQTMYFSNSYILGPLNTPLVSRNYHFIGVSRVSSNGNNGRLLSLSRPGVNDYNVSDTFMFQYTTSPGLGRANSVYATGGTYDTNNFVTMSQNSNLIFAGINAQNISSYTNGPTNTTNVNMWGLAQNAGNTGDFGSRLLGHIGEVLFYQSTLNSLQQQQAEGYLAWKWGLQTRLPDFHLFKNRPPTRKDIISPFSPSTLFGGTIMWIDGSKITGASGASLTSLTNYGTLPSYSMTGTATLSTFGLNNMNVINFNAGSTHAMSTINKTSTLGSFTMAFVSRFNTGNSGGFFVFDNGGNNAYSYQGATKRNFRWSGGYALGPNRAGADGAWDINVFAVSSQSQLLYNYNGTNDGRNYDGYSASSSYAPYYFGSGPGNTAQSGQIAEFILFNSSFSQSTITQVEGYLAWKWGLVSTLPITHPYRYISPDFLGLSTTNVY